MTQSIPALPAQLAILCQHLTKQLADQQEALESLQQEYYIIRALQAGNARLHRTDIAPYADAALHVERARIRLSWTDGDVYLSLYVDRYAQWAEGFWFVFKTRRTGRHHEIEVKYRGDQPIEQQFRLDVP